MPCSGDTPRNPLKAKAFMKEKRTRIAKIRLSESEYLLLNERKTKPRLAEWLREIALDEKPKIPAPTADPKLLYELNRIGVNLNQIARQLHRSSRLESMAVLSALVAIEQKLKELLP